MNMEEFQDLLGEHLDGTLTGARLEAFCRALEENPVLEEEVRVHQELTGMLNRIESPKAPEHLRAKVMGKLLAEHNLAEMEHLPVPEEFGTRFRRFFSGWRMQAAFAGTFVGGMLVAALLLRPVLPGSRPEVSPTAALSLADRPTHAPLMANTITAEAKQEAAASRREPSPSPAAGSPVAKAKPSNAPMIASAIKRSLAPAPVPTEPTTPAAAGSNFAAAPEPPRSRAVADASAPAPTPDESNLEMAQQAEQNAGARTVVSTKRAAPQFPGAPVPQGGRPVASAYGSTQTTALALETQPPRSRMVAGIAASSATPRRTPFSAETRAQESARAMQVSRPPKAELRAPGAPPVTSDEPTAVINVLLRPPASASGSKRASGTEGVSSADQVETVLRVAGVETRRVRIHLDSGRTISGLTCTVGGKDMQWVLQQLARAGLIYAPELNSNPLLAPISVADARRKLQMDPSKTGLAFFSRAGSAESQPVTENGFLTFRLHFELLPR